MSETSSPKGGVANERLPEADEGSERVAVVVRLREAASDRARELIAEGPPFDPRRMGFERHRVFLSPEEVIFMFEGPDATRRLAEMVDDMVVSASFSAWAPLLEGTPRLAHETYSWDARASE